MILENEKSKFLHILKHCKERRKQTFTQKEISVYLEVSLTKVINFEKGKIFDFWFLCRYANINGININFNMNL